MAGMLDLHGAMGVGMMGQAQQAPRGPTHAESIAASWALAFDELAQAVKSANIASARVKTAQKAQDDAWSKLNAVAAGAGPQEPKDPEYDGNVYGSKYGTRKG